MWLHIIIIVHYYYLESTDIQLTITIYFKSELPGEMKELVQLPGA